MPRWQQRYQQNRSGVTEMGAGHAVLETDGVRQMAEVPGSESVGELEAGAAGLGRPQQMRGVGNR